jgi:hypothetical protein
MKPGVGMSGSNFDALHKLGKEAMVCEMPVIKHIEQLCDT